MKYFTPEACDGFDEIEAFRSTYEAYRRQLERLRGTLPDPVLELAEPSGMEDGLVVQVNHDYARRVLRLVLRCGHLQMGYYNLEVTYVGAEITPEHDSVLARIARSTESQRRHVCDLAYQELDAADGGGIEHRLIFFDSSDSDRNTWLWFAVRCRELRWRRVPKKSRRLPPTSDRYPNGPTS